MRAEHGRSRTGVARAASQHAPRAGGPPPSDTLRGVGLRVTPQRIAVLAALSDAEGGHLSADDVWEQAVLRDSTMDRSTAYRVLSDLTGAGLLTQVRFADGVARFEVQSCAHHHAICTQCGLTEDVPVDLVKPLGSALNRTTGFTMSLDEPLLVRGTCRTCMTAKPG